MTVVSCQLSVVRRRQEAGGRRQEEGGCQLRTGRKALCAPLRLCLTAAGIALLAGLVLAGCGYKSAASQRTDFGARTLAVLPLENRTTTFEVEQILTRQLVHAFVEKSSFRVIGDASQADAVLSGSVTRLTANPVIFGPATLGSTFLVTLRAQVELKDRTTGRTLYSNNSYIFREQYQINSDVENFFSERNPAIERIAEDFANAVVTTILESF